MTDISLAIRLVDTGQFHWTWSLVHRGRRFAYGPLQVKVELDLVDVAGHLVLGRDI
jgi:hypothetical protein